MTKQVRSGRSGIHIHFPRCSKSSSRKKGVFPTVEKDEKIRLSLAAAAETESGTRQILTKTRKIVSIFCTVDRGGRDGPIPELRFTIPVLGESDHLLVRWWFKSLQWGITVHNSRFWGIGPPLGWTTTIKNKLQHAILREPNILQCGRYCIRFLLHCDMRRPPKSPV